MPGTESNPVLLLNNPYTTVPASADTPSAGAGQDKVVLNGQDLYVRSLVKGQIVSEFEVGFKIGPARYDNREHAFYYVMDDFSKGFGHRRVDLDKPGYFWVQDPTNAPDVSRPGHMTLGPAFDYIYPNTAPTTHNLINVGPLQTILEQQGAYYVGIGSGVYYTSSGGYFGLSYDTSTADVRAIIPLPPGGKYQPGGGHLPEIWAANSNSYLWRDGAPAAGAQAGGAGYGGTDLLSYDGKLLICNFNVIYFGVLVEGSIEYNLGTEDDNVPIAILPEFTLGTWLGIAEAPWGTMSPYIMSSTKVYVIDFYARKSFEVDIGLGGAPITAATMWGGKFYFSDGWNVNEYDPASRTVQNVGLARQDGVPSELADDGYQVNGFIRAEDRLYVILSDGTYHLVYFMMVGHPGEWQQLGEGAFVEHVAHYGFQLNFGSTRYLYVPGTFDGAANTKVIRYKLPATTRVPVYGRDHFANSGAKLYTSWFDGGFNELDGTALRMTIDAWHLTNLETIEVAFQLDNDEDSDWTSMVDADGNVAVFDVNHRELYFPNSLTDPVKGRQFRTIRWRFTWTRGSNDTRSVEVRAFTFVYKKEPPPRTQWTFVVDSNRMIQEGIDVDGAEPSTASIWRHLLNTKASQTLVGFDVPTVQTGMRVDVDQLIIEADDIHTPESGRSKITVTVIEPIASSIT